MKKQIRNFLLPAFSIVFAFFHSPARAQIKSIEISGKIADTAAEPIEFAAVKLIKTSDSSVVATALSGDKGVFTLKKVPEGGYTIKISFIGYKAFSKTFTLTKTSPAMLNLGTIVLEAGIDLQGITIEAEGPAIKIKQDTTEYNAAAFKTVPGAVVEDLIKKLPGMEVDKDGNIKAQGEAVKKVLVDGKEFFGSDPKIATKNLPADAIKSAQLIDDKTEEAKNSGIDDGKREKVLNLVLKADKKKGWFGNSSIAGGTEDRYLGSLSLNHFDNTKQFNVLMLSNNVNQSGFSFEDASNFAGAGGGTAYSVSNGSLVARTYGGVNIGNASQGLVKTHSGGLNFANAWGKKDLIKINGSYFAYTSSTTRESENNSQTIQPVETVLSSGKSFNISESQSHRFNFRVTTKLDSLTNLTFTPSITFSLSNSTGTHNSLQTNSEFDKINSQVSNNFSKSFSPSFNGSLNLNRSFRKRNGSVSLSINSSGSDNSSKNTDQSENEYFRIDKLVDYNRRNNDERLRNSISVRNTINRTISKDKKTSVFLSNNFSRSVNKSDLASFEYNPLSGEYEIRIDSLTSNSESKTYQYTPGVGLNKTIKTVSIYATLNFQTTYLRGEVLNKTAFQTVSKNYFNILPDISITYRPTRSRSLSLSSYAYSYAPSITDLQEIQNNTSPFYIRQGNPDLKSYQNYTTSLRYNSSDAKKGNYTNLSISYTKMFSAISRSTNTDLNGVQTTRPINVDGNYSLNINGSISIPNNIKGLRISPGIQAQNSRSQGFLNDKANNSDRLTGGGNLTFSYAYKDIFNITLNNRSSYTHVNNSAQKTIINNYLNLNNGGSLSIQPIKKWRINTDFTHISNAGQSFVLLNANIQKQFMKNNRLTAELSGFDLLNKNSDITRSAYDNYISDTRTNNINQYFYLKLLFRVNKIGGSTSKAIAPPVILNYY